MISYSSVCNITEYERMKYMNLFVELLKAVLFGIVEGITEWLPISSTGHLIILDEFISLNQSDAFKEMFEVVIQLGAIMAVVILFWNKLWPFSSGKKGEGIVKKDIMTMWFKVVVACVPTAVIGVFADKYLHDSLYKSIPVAIALISIGAVFIIIENRHKNSKPRVKTIDQITYRDALIIGFCQVLSAVFPGTSRSGSTIMGSLAIGLSREVAAEFTFFLAVPVMFGASLLKVLKFGLDITGAQLAVLVAAMVTAFLTSVIIIKFLMGYIKKHNFKVFGWYRIILGVMVILYFNVFR